VPAHTSTPTTCEPHGLRESPTRNRSFNGGGCVRAVGGAGGSGGSGAGGGGDGGRSASPWAAVVAARSARAGEDAEVVRKGDGERGKGTEEAAADVAAVTTAAVAAVVAVVAAAAVAAEDVSDTRAEEVSETRARAARAVKDDEGESVGVREWGAAAAAAAVGEGATRMSTAQSLTTNM